MPDELVITFEVRDWPPLIFWRRRTLPIQMERLFGSPTSLIKYTAMGKASSLPILSESASAPSRREVVTRDTWREHTRRTIERLQEVVADSARDLRPTHA